MSRETIDFGIDLGTTNSSIAMWRKDNSIEVFKNKEQAACTPSAVSVNMRNGIEVGLRAKNYIERDAHNVSMEFKQNMGKETEYLFPRDGRKMKPEELSAEVLKALKADVFKHHPDFEAAVITIPAAFERSHISATNKAAQLAGFAASPLCIEPVAAALAYGHQNTDAEGFWLIFDFGGGTFDAAVIKYKDEEFQVVNHQGNNHLGGKLIDKAIMDQFLIPAVQKEFNMPDFGSEPDDPAVKTAIAKLKLATEAAKIRLSFDEKTYVEVGDIITTPSGEKLSFEYELSATAVNRMAEPFILRSIKLCKKAMGEKRLSPGDINRLILVGGPTQMPVFREMLADRNVGLGIPLEYSIDPMTVVAQGAAIFARTQKLGKKKKVKPVSGKFSVDIELPTADSDSEPYVGGRVISADHDQLDSFTIEFSSSTWQSGSVPLQPDGHFMTQLIAEPGENNYKIQVKDPSGTPQNIAPETVSYLRKGIFKEIPLTNDICVARADNTIDILFRKGDPLPLHAMRDYRTTVELIPGAENGAIRIPLIEGSNARAYVNSPTGFLEIHSHEVKRPVPVGSKIEFSCSIDLDQMAHAKADIPILNLDEEFQETINLNKPEIDKNRLVKDAVAVKLKLEQLEKEAEETNDEVALTRIKEIEEQGIILEINNAVKYLEAQEGDEDDLLLNRLNSLRSDLYEIEDILEWPRLAAEAEDIKGWCEKVFYGGSKYTGNGYTNSTDEEKYTQLLEQYDHAVSERDPDLLRRVVSELDELYFDIVYRDPQKWAHRLIYIQEELSTKLTDQVLADQLFAQGRRSIDNNDLDSLKSAILQLERLLPREEVRKMETVGFGSTVI